MTKNSVHHASYLRNHTSYDSYLWYPYVKWFYLQTSFSFFQNFNFLGCFGGKKAKIGPKWQKNFVRHASYLRNHISYDCHLWYPCVKWLYLQTFFHFFKILIFWVLGVKRQKTVLNDKKFCPSHFISQEPYIILLWFVVHMCEMVISPANFFIFQNFDFGVFMGAKEQKMT